MSVIKITLEITTGSENDDFLREKIQDIVDYFEEKGIYGFMDSKFETVSGRNALSFREDEKKYLEDLKNE